MAETGNPSAAGSRAPGRLSAASVAAVLLACCLAWLTGVGLQLRLPVLPDDRSLWGAALIALMLAGLGVCLLGRRWPGNGVAGRCFAGLSVCLGVAGFGWAVTGLQASVRLV